MTAANHMPLSSHFLTDPVTQLHLEMNVIASDSPEMSAKIYNVPKY